MATADSKDGMEAAEVVPGFGFGMGVELSQFSDAMGAQVLGMGAVTADVKQVAFWDTLRPGVEVEVMLRGAWRSATIGKIGAWGQILVSSASSVETSSGSKRAYTVFARHSLLVAPAGTHLSRGAAQIAKVQKRTQSRIERAIAIIERRDREAKVAKVILSFVTTDGNAPAEIARDASCPQLAFANADGYGHPGAISGLFQRSFASHSVPVNCLPASMCFNWSPTMQLLEPYLFEPLVVNMREAKFWSPGARTLSQDDFTRALRQPDTPCFSVRTIRRDTDTPMSLLEFKEEPRIGAETAWDIMRAANTQNRYNVVLVAGGRWDTPGKEAAIREAVAKAPINVFVLEVVSSVDGSIADIGFARDTTFRNTAHLRAFITDLEVNNKAYRGAAVAATRLGLRPKEDWKVAQEMEMERFLARPYFMRQLPDEAKLYWPLADTRNFKISGDDKATFHFPLDFSICDDTERGVSTSDQIEVVYRALDHLQSFWKVSGDGKTVPLKPMLRCIPSFEVKPTLDTRPTPGYALGAFEQHYQYDRAALPYHRLPVDDKTTINVAQYLNWKPATSQIHVVFRFCSESDVQRPPEWRQIFPGLSPKTTLYANLAKMNKLFVVNCIGSLYPPEMLAPNSCSLNYSTTANRSVRVTEFNWRDEYILVGQLRRAVDQHTTAIQIFDGLSTSRALSAQQKTLRTNAMARNVQGMVLSFLSGCLRPGCTSESRASSPYCSELCENTHSVT